MAKKETKQNKDKKNFSKDFRAELKKVSWPTPKQLVNNTAIVVVIVIITAVIVFALDLAFNFMHESGVTKLQTVVQEKFSTDEDEEIEVEEETTEESSEENVSNEATNETNSTEANNEENQ